MTTKERIQTFESKPPEIVFEWHDTETDAIGWTVINSLRGGAAGQRHGPGRATGSFPSHS